MNAWARRPTTHVLLVHGSRTSRRRADGRQPTAPHVGGRARPLPHVKTPSKRPEAHVVESSGSGPDDPSTVAAHRWVLLATILGSSMVFLDGSTVNVALSALQRSLGATVVDVQWVVNGYTLFLASLLLLGGSLGDRLGRRRMFLLGVVVFTAASVGCGLAPGTRSLIIARCLQGVGGALLTPGSLALINASFPKNARGRAIGLWAGFSAITSAIGPVVGGWLIDTLSWRWIFFMNVPLAAIVLINPNDHICTSTNIYIFAQCILVSK